ncbi:fatty acid desaturase [Marinibaculum pumilum]|uniref:Fatty acid desaturase n=1 Tax=Marinibaculum pumilum TaxID=1766165 RepID=A0ABV7KZ48_9PROT
MYVAAGISVPLTLALAIPTGALLVRVFIVQHDCGHGAFFRGRRANAVLGNICGVLTLTPYANWRRQHARHHASWNNLDQRQSGLDIYSVCLTVSEYRALPGWQRRLYRVGRHPLVMHLLLPPLIFLLLYRVPFDTPPRWRRERWSVYLTNLALLCLFGGLAAIFGIGTVALVHLPVIAVGAVIGVWLFTLQHRYDGALWSRDPQWSHERASLEGSSHLRLPRILQWFTGNIGLHHIHHLAPRIPNYQLQACHDALPELRRQKPLDLWGGLKAMRLSLWDEGRNRMIGFRDMPDSRATATAG